MFALARCLFISSLMLPAAALAADVGLPLPTWAPDVYGGYASTHILVKFRTEYRELAPVAALGGDGFSLKTRSEPDARGRTSRRSAGASPLDAMSRSAQSALRALNELGGHWKVGAVAKVFVGDHSDPALAASIGLDRTYRLEVQPGTDTPSMAAAYALLAAVEYAELDGIGGVAAFVPDDDGFAMQWNMNNTGQTGGTVDADVDAVEAWEIHTGNEGTVTIAIVDSGVDPHVEFTGRMLPGTNTNNPGTPDDTSDGCTHGTHVAGIAAARGNNMQGVAGMTWAASILPVRVLGGCTGLESQCAAGIEWSADNGAHVCNMSLQYYLGTQALEDAVDYAYGLGVLVVAAAGNGHGNTIAYPARFENCMAVSATTHNDTLYLFSNWGNELDVSAPGDDVWSTWPQPPNSYDFLSGTSMASPHVAGLAALMMSYVTSATADMVRQTLADTADDLGDPGWDNLFGAGRINAHAALVSIEEQDPVGVCCDGAGGCAELRASECGGNSFAEGGACTPNPCPASPTLVAVGGRYLEVNLAALETGTPVALKITSQQFPCLSMFVDGVGRLVDTPEFKTPSEWGEVLIADVEIVPETTYRVHAQLMSGLAGVDDATTWNWGDTDQNGVANLGDVQFIVLGFQGDFTNATLEALDLWPCTPNAVINLDDAQQGVLAFQGQTFAESFCGVPCSP